MNLNEVMKFVESEYIVINNTPCELCGGSYLTESGGLSFENGKAENITHCICEKCGHEREFSFRAPFINTMDNQDTNSDELN